MKNQVSRSIAVALILAAGVAAVSWIEPRAAAPQAERARPSTLARPSEEASLAGRWVAPALKRATERILHRTLPTGPQTAATVVLGLTSLWWLVPAWGRRAIPRARTSALGERAPPHLVLA